MQEPASPSRVLRHRLVRNSFFQRRRGRHHLPRRDRYLSAGASAAIIAAALSTGVLLHGTPVHGPASPAAVVSADRQYADDRVGGRPAGDRAGRQGRPGASSRPSAQPSTQPSAQPRSPATAPASPAPTAPATPVAPVAGLDRAQMDNAATIVRVCQRLGLPDRAAVIAVATAMQESDLYNIASGVVPESFAYPHQGSGTDHDSVGLFQQRPSSGWGSVAELMDPATSARLFLAALSRVPGWDSMALTDAAQAVQRSAFGYAYQKHEPRAQQVVTALLGG